MARALAAAIVVSLLAVSGAGGAGAQKPQRGGTVVIGLPGPGGPFCLNFLHAPCDIRFELPEFTTVLEGAFEVTPDFTYRPNLVSSVKYTTKRPFTLTYRIRPEASWSDGTPVTSRDFEFTYRTIVDPKLVGDPDVDLAAAGYRAIRQVRTLDPKTLRVVLRSRFAGWRDLFAFVLPRHVLAGQDLTSIWRRGIDNPRTGSPIGSGPFLVARFEPRTGEVTLVRNRNYWGPHTAYLDRLVIRIVGDEAGQALRNGEIDVAVLPLASRSEIAELRRVSRVVMAPGTSWAHLDIRVGEGGHPALRTKLVRRALAYGVDRAGLLRLEDLPPGLRQLDSVFFLTNSRLYRPHWSVYRYRPAESRRLLAQAGCRRGVDAIYVCGDERLSLRLVTTPSRARIVARIQADLREAGVEVVPVYAPGSALFGQILPGGAYDLTVFNWIYGPDPSLSVDIFGCGGPQNYTGYCQRLVTRDLNQSNLIFDDAQRARALNRADAQMAKDVPVLPLFQVSLIEVVRPELRSYVPNAGPDWFTWNAEDWWLER